MSGGKITEIIGFMNCFTSGLSGGDRILIELTRRWLDKGLRIHLVTSKEGYEVCQKYGLRSASYLIVTCPSLLRLNVYLLYLLRALKALVTVLNFRPEHNDVVVYSSSDFWPDSIPAWLLKMRFKNIKWVAAFYLFAPSPLREDTPYRGWHFLRGLFYFLSQLPIYGLIKKYADMVWVTSEFDRWRFIDGGRLTADKVIAVRGGVDIRTPMSVPEPEEKMFDAVYIGRFHPQKGVLELIDVWRYVCEKKPEAKLAVIGVGELENEVKEKIRKYGLENNVILFGFKDGVEKLKIFKESKVVVHSAIYDSGGMAACEAMACGLPGVSFDLPALRTYYPKGMLKTPCYDLKKFAENILKLLNNDELYRKMGKDALDWAMEWDWDKRSEELLDAAKKLLGNKN